MVRRAFGGCDALTTLTIPANVEDGLFEALTGGVGNGSGEYPHLDGVKLAEGSPYSIEDGVLYKGTTLVYLLDRDAESIEVKAGTTEIAENAFLFDDGAVSSRLKSVTFADNSLKVIGPSAFFGCAIEEIDLPSSVTTIGESAFEGCSYLKRVTLPAGVTTISNSAFETCTSLETIDLSNVTAIGAEAFKNCTSLSRVSLPEGLKAIGESAFYFSSTGNFGDGLEYINIPSTVTSLGDQFATMTGEGVVVSAVADAGIFTSTAISGFGKAVLIYPEEYAEAYKNNGALTEAGIVSQEGEDDITYALSLTPASLKLLDVETKTVAVTAAVPEGYKLVMTNSDANVATAELSGNIITVKALKDGSTTISVSIVSEDENITLVTKNCSVVVGASYTVTIVYGNGAADDIVYIAQGESYKLPAAPSNSGYIFLGWRGADGRTYKTGDVVEISGDTTFKAVWGNLPDVTEPSEPETPDTPVFPFYDVTARDWYYSAVKYVYEKGLMDGVDVGVFAPNDTLTRAMVWTIIARAEGVDTTGGATWYAKAQEWVTAKGISDGENPNAAITRQELVTMLYRLAGEPAVSGTITAPDAASVSSWAQNAMTWAMSTSLIEGDENGAVTPTATATRAQAAAIFMRFIENIK